MGTLEINNWATDPDVMAIHHAGLIARQVADRCYPGGVLTPMNQPRRSLSAVSTYCVAYDVTVRDGHGFVTGHAMLIEIP